MDRNFNTISEEGLEKIAKIKNLSQNELDQITKDYNLSQNELQRIAKMRRIKNYKRMSKKELIVALTKSTRSIAELFNNNLDNDKISDAKKILNRLRYILPKKNRKGITKSFMK